MPCQSPRNKDVETRSQVLTPDSLLGNEIMAFHLMTEREWLTCTCLPKMLSEIDAWEMNERKGRLFTAGCARRLVHLVSDVKVQKALETAEKYADGQANESELLAAHQIARKAVKTKGGDAEWLIRWATDPDPRAYPCSFLEAGEEIDDPDLEIEPETYSEEEGEVAILRDIVGNPFHPLPPKRNAKRWNVEYRSWLSWQGATIPKLAQSIYEERAFDRLPILADALEEAGCTDPAILNHCRQPGVHVRGCWAVDLLIGRK
jgi:hypothetical protein